MLSTPRIEDIRASGVGRQTWKKEETLAKKAVVGSQWSGSTAVVASESGQGGGII